ncbi:hypothetical protein DVH24_007052 [Malus domestica]|uniref:WAT1-related protein n=1 Tax=Malus domestica TaxID=3750 RepID=A0A498HE99_MALDO|nr:hypothetical protein DVH24_007052 [Malus domestica]
MSIEGFLPFIGMVIAMMVQTGSMVVNKAAMSKGTNAYIIVVYANAVSALILLPSALIFHSCTSQIFGNIGIEYSSPTLSTAMLNLIPAFTFILAIIFRFCFFSFLLTFLILTIIATMVKKYPAIVFIVFFQCLFATMQSAAFTLIAVRGASAWEIRLDVGIIAILYTGIVSTVLRYSLVTWCVKKAGAFYCSMFKPLGIIFGVIMGVIFLGDSVYLGRIQRFDLSLWFVTLIIKLISFFALVLCVLGRSERPPLTFSIISWFFLIGLIGFMAQFLGYAGIKYSSPTLSTAMLNLIPAFTFVLAVIFRMERIDVRSFSSLAKTLGTIVSISGAFIVTLYKGPPILNTSSTVMTDMLSQKQLLSEQSNWVLGGVCVAANCMLAASWLIVQASVLKKYRAELIMGVFGLAFQVGVSTWCLRRTEPVFAAMFKHLGIVVAVFIGVTFLGDTFYLGRSSCYCHWILFCDVGKANEEKRGDDAGEGSLASSKQRVPLLQSHIEEI